MLTRCEVTTFEPEPLLDLPFDDKRRVQKLLMKVHYPYTEPYHFSADKKMGCSLNGYGMRFKN
jgi:hypothetical protein